MPILCSPLRLTLCCFQAKSPAIVMLCRLMESGVCKCFKYWPDTTSANDVAKDADSGLEIKLLSEEVSCFPTVSVSVTKTWACVSL